MSNIKSNEPSTNVVLPIINSKNSVSPDKNEKLPLINTNTNVEPVTKDTPQGTENNIIDSGEVVEPITNEEQKITEPKINVGDIEPIASENPQIVNTNNIIIPVTNENLQIINTNLNSEQNIIDSKDKKVDSKPNKAKEDAKSKIETYKKLRKHLVNLCLKMEESFSSIYASNNAPNKKISNQNQKTNITSTTHSKNKNDCDYLSDDNTKVNNKKNEENNILSDRCHYDSRSETVIRTLKDLKLKIAKLETDIDSINIVNKVKENEQSNQLKKKNLEELKKENEILKIISNNQSKYLDEIQENTGKREEINKLNEEIQILKEEIKNKKDEYRRLDQIIKGQNDKIRICDEKTKIINENINYKKKKLLKNRLRQFTEEMNLQDNNEGVNNENNASNNPNNNEDVSNINKNNFEIIQTYENNPEMEIKALNETFKELNETRIIDENNFRNINKELNEKIDDFQSNIQILNAKIKEIDQHMKIEQLKEKENKRKLDFLYNFYRQKKKQEKNNLSRSINNYNYNSSYFKGNSGYSINDYNNINSFNKPTGSKNFINYKYDFKKGKPFEISKILNTNNSINNGNQGNVKGNVNFNGVSEEKNSTLLQIEQLRSFIQNAISNTDQEDIINESFIKENDNKNNCKDIKIKIKTDMGVGTDKELNSYVQDENEIY